MEQHGWGMHAAHLQRASSVILKALLKESLFPFMGIGHPQQCVFPQ